MKKLLLIMVVVVFVSGCSVKVEDIDVEEDTISVAVGDEENFHYEVYPDNASRSSVSFVSSDETIAVVKNKKIIGVGDGTCNIIAMADNQEFDSLNVVVHTHQWTDIVTVYHHEEEGHFREWDETVVDKAAWDEVIVDKAAWDEEVLVKAAWDEVVVDQEAWDEKVIDQEYIAPVWKGQNVCGKCGRVSLSSANLSGQKCDSPICGGHYVYHGQWVGGQEEISHIVHHEAVTHTVHHEDEYGTVHHDAVTHTVHHEAETHTVHHDAIYNEVDFSKGNKNYWVVDKEAWDEEIVVGHKCTICEKQEDNKEGLEHLSELNKQ